MKVVQKQNSIKRNSSSLRTLGIRNLLFLGIFLVFGAAVIFQFTNPAILNDLRQQAALLNGSYLDTFDGNPSAPEPFRQIDQNKWDVQIHSRNSDTWYQLEPMQADHGPGCERPEKTSSSLHTVTNYEDVVFRCKDHVMTAINSSSYGLTYLTPNTMVDFSEGEAVISFDLSTFTHSNRDWVDVWITPWNDNLAAPFHMGGVDLQGTPKNAIRVGTGNAENAFVIQVFKDNKEVFDIPGWRVGGRINSGIASGTNQHATRQPFRLTISKNRVKMERLASSTGEHIVYFDEQIPDPGFTQGVVQFGHHSYTPDKDGNKGPNTWHWDNFSISPAIPFTMVKADKRYVNEQIKTINFQQPAPANGMLRFLGIGKIEISYDGGAFQAARVQPGHEQVVGDYHPEHMSNYWTPIPAGAKTATFRFSKDSWYEGPFIAKDFAIWSPSSTGGSDPVPNPTETVQLTPAPSPTLVPSTPAPTSAAETPLSVLSLIPSTQNINQNQTFTVDLSVNPGGNSINAVDANLSFPSDKLRLNSVTINSAFEVEIEKEIGTGTARIVVGSSTPKTGTIKVATLSFTALQSTGTAGVTIAGAEVISSKTNTNVLKETKPGSYNIIAPTPTRTPTPIPTKTPTPTPTRIPTSTPTPIPTARGDLNNDGRIDIQDLSLFLTYWRNKDQRGDLNGDQKLNVRDVSILVSGWTG